MVKIRAKNGRKKEPRTGGSAAEALNFGDAPRGEAGWLRVWFKMSGVEEGGGEPSSGIPPTKKAPPLCQRRRLHGSFNLPADVIGSEPLTKIILAGRGVKARG